MLQSSTLAITHRWLPDQTRCSLFTNSTLSCWERIHFCCYWFPIFLDFSPKYFRLILTLTLLFNFLICWRWSHKTPTEPGKVSFYFYPDGQFALSLHCMSTRSPLSERIFSSNYHHHHVVPLTRISLTSRYFSLLFIAFGRSSGIHPVSTCSLLYVCSSWSSCFVLAICGGP